MAAFLIALVTVFSTLAGGYIAIRNKHRLHLVLGLTAGIILGVVAFEILPETFHLAEEGEVEFVWPMLALVAGFLLFHIVEKGILIHHAHEHEYGKHKHPRVGMFSAGALIGHSFLDGMAVGLAFQVDTVVGVAVAIAVIGHDFADGINTTSLMLAHKNSLSRTKLFLGLDAIAPVLGVLATLLISVSPAGLAIYLGFFAGFLLYIGASDILPQAHEESSSRYTVMLTVVGAAFIFAISQLGGHSH